MARVPAVKAADRDLFHNIGYLTSPSFPSTPTDYAWLPAHVHWQTSHAYIFKLINCKQ
jgi:hypothetical protein